MLKHSREEWDDILQKVMTMMEDDYPNNYELVVNSFSAEIRSNLTTMCFTKKHYLKDLHKKCCSVKEPVTVDISKLKVGELGDPNNKAFDVVEAFHRMLLGRKVRRVDWEPEEWIELTPNYYIIRNQRKTTMNLSILTSLESRKEMWEEYIKEE